MFYIFWLWKAWNTIAGSVFGTMLLKLWGVRLHGIVKCVGLPRLEIDPKGNSFIQSLLDAMFVKERLSERQAYYLAKYGVENGYLN